MSSFMKQGAWCVVVAAALSLTGCNGQKPIPTEDFQNLRTLDQKSDQYQSWIQNLGDLMPGQMKSVHYRNPARLRLFRIQIAVNVSVDIDVKSSNGDAVAWLVDSQFQVKAWNDDRQPGSSDSRIQWRAPAQQQNDSYYLAFRDYGLNQADFDVGYGQDGKMQDPGGGGYGDQGGQSGGQNGGQNGQGCDKGQFQGSCSPGWVWDDQSCECVEDDGGHCGKQQSCDKGSSWDAQSCQCRPNGYK